MFGVQPFLGLDRHAEQLCLHYTDTVRLLFFFFLNNGHAALRGLHLAVVRVHVGILMVVMVRTTGTIERVRDRLRRIRER